MLTLVSMVAPSEQRRPKQVQIVLMDEVGDGLPVTVGRENGRALHEGAGICKKNCSFGVEDGEKLTDAFEQCGERALWR